MNFISDRSINENPGLDLLTADQVAEILGIHRSTVYEMIQKREITRVKFGRSVRIRRLDLEKFINDHVELERV